MKKTGWLIALLLFPLLSIPARADTVRTGQWIEIRLTHCTANGDYGKTGDPLVSFGGEGFDSVLFRWENRAAGGSYELIAEHEGAVSGAVEESFTFPALPGKGERNEWGDYLVSAAGSAEDGEIGFLLDIPAPHPDEPWTMETDNTAPSVSIVPVADRMLVTVSDEGGLAFVGDSLAPAEAEPHGQYGGSHDGISYVGRKTVSYVSDPILWSGGWSYTFYACDRAGNMTVRTVFLRTTGLEEMPDSVRYAEEGVPQTTAPNTADCSLLTAAAAGLCAAFARLSFRKAKTKARSR